MAHPYRNSSPRSRRLLVAVAFDAVSGSTLEMGATLAQDPGGSIHVLYVLEALMYAPLDPAIRAAQEPDLHPEATRNMQSAVRRLKELGVETVTGTIEFGIAEDVIVRYANSAKFDLIVLGSRGSMSAYVISHVSVPVMIVPFGSA